MNKQCKELIHFAQSAKGLDNQSKIKLILLAAGAKPATFFPLKINPKNLGEKAHLEKHLKACRIIFTAGRPRAYEEVDKIKGNAVIWKIKGSWYGYDLFSKKKNLSMFKKYVGLLKKQKHSQADILAGKLYDYPACCIKNYITEQNPEYLRKKYTHYSYYKRVHDLERKFPLLIHTPCSLKCAKSRSLNEKYAKILKKSAPKFWKQYSAVKKHKTDIIIDSESELPQIFPEKDGHEYIVIALKQIDGRYYLYSHLTKSKIVHGSVIPATIKMSYNHADLTLGKSKRVIKNLHRERRFVLP